MDLETYNYILSIANTKLSRLDCYNEIKLKYPKVNFETFTSICGLLRRKIFKSTQWRKAKENSIQIYNKYEQLTNDFKYGHGGVIIKLALEYNLPPVLMARIILEGHMKQNNIESLVESSIINMYTGTKLINLLIKETNLIQNERLAAEIFQASIQDDEFGPCIDIIKNSIGIEYELKLNKILKDNQICFQTEEQLRQKGFDKTPDFKLELPIIVNDKWIINWIESKASFGDMNSHQQYNDDQFKGYLNRFGPGLVIYWFGYLNNIIDDKNSSILIMDHFPSNFVSFNVNFINEQKLD